MAVGLEAGERAGILGQGEESAEIQIEGPNVHIAVVGVFGTGVVSLRQHILGSTQALNNDGTPITISQDDDSAYGLKSKDTISLSVAGGDASTKIYYSINWD